jgi:hypothetical protein
MATSFYPNENQDGSIKDGLSTWDEVRRLADELELKMHLARMDARDRWHALQPRLAELRKQLADTSERAEEAIAKELSALRTLLRQLRGEILEDS